MRRNRLLIGLRIGLRESNAQVFKPRFQRHYPMISKRYIISSTDPEFVGPLDLEYRGAVKYIGDFHMDINFKDFNEWMRTALRNRTHSTDVSYVSDSHHARLFDDFESRLAVLLLSSLVDTRKYAFEIKESPVFDGELEH